MTLFIFVIMFTYSCSNENSIQQESKNIPVDFTKMNIGELHNQYMSPLRKVGALINPC